MAAQDMPPPGGYAAVNVERTFAKPFIRHGVMIVIMGLATLNGFKLLKEWKKRMRVERIEQSEHYIAAEPFLVAEAERKFLRHLRVIREEERELMKDVPGWKVGTLYGEPVFKSLPENVIPPLTVIDYMVHRPINEFVDNVAVPDIKT